MSSRMEQQDIACAACGSKLSMKATIPHAKKPGVWVKISIDFKLTDGNPIYTAHFAEVAPPADEKSFIECDRCYDRQPWTFTAVWHPDWKSADGSSGNMFVDGFFDPLS